MLSPQCIWRCTGLLRRAATVVAAALFAGALVSGCGGAAELPGAELTMELAFRYTPAPANPFTPPLVAQLLLPRLPGADAIWGATGRDDRGHIWLGVTAGDRPDASAYLVEYVPETGEFIVRGDVVSELKRCGAYREGERQEKIHTKIYQGVDGHLYFASTDLSGGDFALGTTPPKWGGHLWRLRLPENEWEPLLATPEGILALSLSGRFVYALGFFGHKVYQYDCQTGGVRSVVVGSLDGHISRNIFSDRYGHVYVPRLRRAHDVVMDFVGAEPRVDATLVEYDTELREVGESRLEYYLGKSPTESHGLTAFQPMADGSVIVMTALGYMHRVVPRAGRSAKVIPVGWLNPLGSRYAASLFTYDGKRYVMGLTTGDKDKEAPPRDFEWVIYDLAEGRASVTGFNIGGPSPPPIEPCLLYGSATRDDQGRFYVVGRAKSGSPIVLQVACP
jgi:hypothetical protein